MGFFFDVHPICTQSFLWWSNSEFVSFLISSHATDAKFFLFVRKARSLFGWTCGVFFCFSRSRKSSYAVPCFLRGWCWFSVCSLINRLFSNRGICTKGFQLLIRCEPSHTFWWITWFVWVWWKSIWNFTSRLSRCWRSNSLATKGIWGLTSWSLCCCWLCTKCTRSLLSRLLGSCWSLVCNWLGCNISWLLCWLSWLLRWLSWLCFSRSSFEIGYTHT